MQVEEGWWEGILNGKTGMFPSNFIKELSDSEDAGIEEQVKPSKEKILMFCMYACVFTPYRVDRVAHSYLLLESVFE